MKWGEVWTVAAGGGYAGKPRSVVVLQDDRIDATDSITNCGFTTDPTDALLIRPVIEPSERNGLRTASCLMGDKVTTIPRSKLGDRLGRLDDEDVVRNEPRGSGLPGARRRVDEGAAAAAIELDELTVSGKRETHP